jgi:hypothetical protein
MQANEAAVGMDDTVVGVKGAIVWDDDVQQLWERLRTGPAVRSTGDGTAMMFTPTAVDEYLHRPTLMSSNPDALFMGSEKGLIPLQVDPPPHVRHRRMRSSLHAAEDGHVGGRGGGAGQSAHRRVHCARHM